MIISGLLKRKSMEKLAFKFILFALVSLLNQNEVMVRSVLAGQEATILGYVYEVDGMGTIESNGGDFYVKIYIEGVLTYPNPFHNLHQDDTDKITPMWPIMKRISGAITKVPVSIELYDHDSVTSDDLIDIHPDAGHKKLDLIANMENRTISLSSSGKVIGNMGEKITMTGNTEDERAKIVFSISGDITYTSDIAVTCSHKPLLPKQGENVEFQVYVTLPESDKRARNMQPLLYINDKPAEEGYADKVFDKVNFAYDPNVPETHSKCWIDRLNSIPCSLEKLSGGNIAFMYTFTNKYDTSNLSIPAKFQYKCNLVDSLDGLISGGWKEIQIGASEGEGIVTPVLVSGPMSSKIDVVFIADKSDYDGGSENPGFISTVNEIIFEHYLKEPIFRAKKNTDMFNFWIARVSWDAYCLTEGVMAFVNPPSEKYLPPAHLIYLAEAEYLWAKLYPFADFGILVHESKPICRDRFSPRSRMVTVNVLRNSYPILHETGHAFGLADEYCCDGGYFTTDNYPNNVYSGFMKLSDGPKDCKKDAPNLGRKESDCWGFDSFWPWDSNPGYFDVNLSEPKNDKMGSSSVGGGENAPFQAGDIRRIQYIFDRCALNNCEEIKR